MDPLELDPELMERLAQHVGRAELAELLAARAPRPAPPSAPTLPAAKALAVPRAVVGKSLLVAAMEFMARRGDKGATREEAGAALVELGATSTKAAGVLMARMQRAGQIRDSGRKRKNANGRAVAVWVWAGTGPRYMALPSA